MEGLTEVQLLPPSLYNILFIIMKKYRVIKVPLHKEELIELEDYRGLPAYTQSQMFDKWVYKVQEYHPERVYKKKVGLFKKKIKKHVCQNAYWSDYPTIFEKEENALEYIKILKEENE